MDVPRPSPNDGKVQLGTTIMASTFNGGVVLAADSRTSSGAYIANRAASKINELAENIYMCRSGAASDTQAIRSYVEYYLAHHQIELNHKPLVSVASNLVRQLQYNNKELLSAGIIVAGYDDTAGAQVYSLPLGGTRLKVPYAIGGSGSAYIAGYFEKYWKSDMLEEDCVEFCRKAVAHAFARDASSGGCVRIVVVTKDGVRSEYVPNTSAHQCYGEKDIPVWSGFAN